MNTLWIPGLGVPFQRTRYNRATNRFYQHPDYAQWKEDAGWIMKQVKMMNGAVELDIIVSPDGIRVDYREVADNHRVVKKGMRGDLDNYGKAVVDAGNGIMYGDDRQVVILSERFSQ